MTRAEHLQWAKDRALEYVDSGDIAEAFAFMASDLGKHPELASSQNLMPLAMVHVQNNDGPAMRRFINGFN